MAKTTVPAGMLEAVHIKTNYSNDSRKLTEILAEAIKWQEAQSVGKSKKRG